MVKARLYRSRLGVAIDEARQARGQRLKDVAAMLGVNVATLYRVRRFPLVRALSGGIRAKLAGYLGWTEAAVVAAAAVDGEGAEVVAKVLPLATHAGVCYGPPVTLGKQAGCAACEYRVACYAQVVHGDGFALCERLIAADLLPDVVLANYSR